MRPTAINVLGRDYSIEYVKSVCEFESKYNGRAIHEDRRILIEDNSVEERNTLIHETIHCIDEMMGIHLTENQVIQLANGLEVFITGNPEAMQYLEEP